MSFNAFEPTINEAVWGGLMKQTPSAGVAPTDYKNCLLYTSPSPRDGLLSRMPSSA